jgi:hypothetical protein
MSVDLRGRSITGTLPFDIPFNLTGVIPDTVDRVSVQFAECPRGKCPAVQPDPAGCGVILPGTVIWHPSPGEAQMVWTRDPVIDQPHAGEAAAPFVIGMPMLEAQREFVFVFDVQSRPTAAATDAMRAQVRELLRKEFDSLAASPDNRTLTKVQAVVIQKRVVDEIKSIVPCARTAGALSDNASAEDVHRLFTPGHLTDVTSRTRVKLDVTKLEKEAPSLPEALQVIRRDAPNKALPALAGAPASARNKTVIADLTNLASLSNAEMMSIGRGADPDHPDTRLGPYTDQLTEVEMDARANALQNLHSAAAGAAEALAAVQDASPDGKSVPAIMETKAALEKIAVSTTRMVGAAHDYVRNVRESTRQEATFSALVESVVKSVFVINGSSVGDFDTNSSWYVSADPGLAWAPGIEKIVPYTGTNIYFRPVNRDTPLRLRSSFGRRFALSIGLTLGSVSEAGKRGDLFGSQALLVGFGYRITDAIRVSGGGLVFQKEDPNPLISHKRLGAVPYFSMSFDWDVKKLTSVLSGILP